MEHRWVIFLVVKYRAVLFITPCEVLLAYCFFTREQFYQVTPNCTRVKALFMHVCIEVQQKNSSKVRTEKM